MSTYYPVAVQMSPPKNRHFLFAQLSFQGTIYILLIPALKVAKWVCSILTRRRRWFIRGYLGRVNG